MRWVGSDEEDSDDERGAQGRGLRFGKKWEALGPFTAGMREHPMFASPLHAFGGFEEDHDLSFASQVYDENETWPSELGTGGRVGWKRFKADDDGWVRVSYPDVKWDQLRSDHGWASLQYQVLLRTSLSIPLQLGLRPSSDRGPETPIGLRVDARQLTEYAFIRKDPPHEEPVVWYHGDMYDFAGSSTGQRCRTGATSNFARSITLAAGEYMVIARAIYEIRLFGDPGSKPPTVQFKLEVELDFPREDLKYLPGLNIVPDVVDGLFMGDFISLGLRVPSARPGVSVPVEGVSTDTRGVMVSLVLDTKLAQGQTRMLILRVDFHSPLSKSTGHISVLLSTGTASSDALRLDVPLRHRDRDQPFKISFPSPSEAKAGLPAQIGCAMVIPPAVRHAIGGKTAKDTPVILALHGAGVDVEWDTWINAIPKTGGWAILPTGKNEWGEDWHGGSMADAWAARDALPRVLAKMDLEVTDRTLVIGHSNGGQGAWHLAARYPDRVVGVIGAAGYLKIQDYVPYSELTGHHHTDPALMGILASSLSPYNNDLHLSNLARIPCLALHGGSDDNVPPRHSRLYANIISSWQHDKQAVEVVEVPCEGHWWDGMFEHPKVKAFIKRVLSGPPRSSNDDRKRGFTLTCAVPEENGGRAGIRIVELETPGRIARLDVNAPQWRKGEPASDLDLRGMNIKRIEMNVGGQLENWTRQQDGLFSMAAERYQARAYGPMIRMLASTGLLHIVVGPAESHRGLAKRLAHDVFTHHRLDSVINGAEEALRLVAVGTLHGNVVVIGGPKENLFAEWLLKQSPVPVSFPTAGIFQVLGKTVYENGSGIISLLPHPIHPAGLALLLAGNDPAGLAAASRLFPIRTGVPVPDWVVVGPRMAWQAAGGIIGAGFWSGEWTWNGKMSWFDR